MNINMRNFAIWALILTMFAVMVTMSQGSLQTKDDTTLGYSELIEQVEAGTITEATIDEMAGLITGKTSEGRDFKSNISRIEGAIGPKMEEAGVNVEYAEVKRPNQLMNIFLSSLPLILIPAIDTDRSPLKRTIFKMSHYLLRIIFFYFKECKFFVHIYFTNRKTRNHSVFTYK